MIFPAKHFVVGQDKMDTAIRNISDELDERLNEFNLSNKLLEAQRLEQRTRFDIEMLQDLILAAVNGAIKLADDETNKAMSKLQGGMGGFPGLF